MPEDKRRPPRANHQGAAPASHSVSPGGLREEVVIFELRGLGKVLAVLPVIPEDAPYPVREGIARRRVTTTTGECPCGARMDLVAARRDGIGSAEVAHDNRCPAATHRLVKAVRRWTR